MVLKKGYLKIRIIACLYFDGYCFYFEEKLIALYSYFNQV